MNNSYNSKSENVDDANIYILIGTISFLALGFLIWLIYFRSVAETAGEGRWVELLPVVNVFLNTLTSISLISGFVFIKKNHINLHKKAMLTATFTSALFLISYVTYHHFHGDTKFQAMGLIRPVYFGILITHILLSAVQVPLILATLYLALTKKFVKHKKLAKITFPVWLYVSITGVLIFIILRWFNL